MMTSSQQPTTTTHSNTKAMTKRFYFTYFVLFRFLEVLGPFEIWKYLEFAWSRVDVYVGYDFLSFRSLSRNIPLSFVSKLVYYFLNDMALQVNIL